MAIPRHKLVDEENACCYHLASRCARRSWLLGRDPLTGRDYSYRKSWLVDRMNLIAPSFAVEIYGFAVMNNHFHLVLHYDPKACESWSDEEVARRWVEAFPPVAHGKVVEERKAEKREMLLGDPDRLERLRRTLGSLSAFMKHLQIERTYRMEMWFHKVLLERIFYLRFIQTTRRSERRLLQRICNFCALRPPPATRRVPEDSPASTITRAQLFGVPSGADLQVDGSTARGRVRGLAARGTGITSRPPADAATCSTGAAP